MKILWFANTPCGATEKLTGKPVIGGGWLYALSQQLMNVDDVDLHIGFYWGESMESFCYNGITYHPIYREGENSRWGRLINRYYEAYTDKLDKHAFQRLRKVVEEVRPDIIHIHGSEENFGILAEKQLPCPVVLSIQGLLSLSIYIYYRGLPKRTLQKNEGLIPKIAMGSISTNEHSFRRRAEREKRIFKNIPNIIGRTFWDKAGSYALNPKRRYYEVGEIMRPIFYEAQWDKKSFNDTIIITSTISSGLYKGLETVFYTASVLNEAGFKFSWNIIGTSPKESLVRISEKLVGNTADHINIHLLGQKNAEEMVEIMKQADIYVQVSHIENSPNSLCEAMLMGMPIIASFAGGTASMLENNIEGRLLQDGEPYSLAGMIMEMANDFSKAKELGRNARNKALSRHDPVFVCKQLITSYHSILDNEGV